MFYIFNILGTKDEMLQNANDHIDHHNDRVSDHQNLKSKKDNFQEMDRWAVCVDCEGAGAKVFDPRKRLCPFFESWIS